MTSTFFSITFFRNNEILFEKWNLALENFTVYADFSSAVVPYSCSETDVLLASVCVSSPGACWLWDLLRVLEILEIEGREEPTLLARDMGKGTGVMGGESNCI